MCTLTVHGPWPMSKSSEEPSFDGHNIELVVAVTERGETFHLQELMVKGNRTGRFHPHNTYNIYVVVQFFPWLKLCFPLF